MAVKVTLAPINFITGQLGAGKSVYSTRIAFDYLARGKYVALNYDLLPWIRPGKPEHPYTGVPWYKTIFDSKKHHRSLKNNPSYRFDFYRDVCSKAHRFEEQDDLYDFELPGDPDIEDRGLLVIDEGALRMNSRDWQQRGQANKKKHGHHLRDLEFMVNMRKLGWTCLIVTQGYGMVDAQYRELGPTEIHMRNFNKWRMPGLGISASPVPAFVAIHWQRENKMVTGRDWFLLDKSAGHFKSLQRFTLGEEREVGMRLQYRFPEVVGRAVPTLEEWEATERPDRQATQEPPNGRTVAPRRRGRSCAPEYTPEGVAVLVAPPETVMEHSKHICYICPEGGKS